MPDTRTIRIGTRGSPLARVQTAAVAERLRKLGHVVEVEVITTTGDVRTDAPVASIVGAGPVAADGVFVRELERALVAGSIDAAVHSLKDLPTAVPAGLCLACVPDRVSPFDVLVAAPGTSLARLPRGAVVGTSSLRRAVQVKAARPDLVVQPIRGNVDTRLRKLDAGACDCLIVAGAGLHRLGFGDRVSQILEPPAFWPAVAQGALAIEIRAGDGRMQQAVAALDDPGAHAAVRAERACLAALAGGCLAPIGAWGRSVAGRLKLGAAVFEDLGDGVRTAAVDIVATDDVETPEALGRRVAEALLAEGAADMLRSMRDRHPPGR